MFQSHRCVCQNLTPSHRIVHRVPIANVSVAPLRLPEPNSAVRVSIAEPPAFVSVAPLRLPEPNNYCWKHFHHFQYCRQSCRSLLPVCTLASNSAAFSQTTPSSLDKTRQPTANQLLKPAAYNSLRQFPASANRFPFRHDPEVCGRPLTFPR